MSEDHVFIDSLGRVFRGREEMRKGNVVVLLGTASGTYCVEGKLFQENHWEVPAAWKAVVQDDLLTEWQVYTDNSPVFRIMEANNP